MLNFTTHRAGLSVSFVVAFGAMLLAGPAAVCAQTAAEAAGRWLPLPGLDGGTGVTAMCTWDPDGAGPLPELLVLSGDFVSADGQRARGLAAWDGAEWTVNFPTSNVGTLTVWRGGLYSNQRMAAGRGRRGRGDTGPAGGGVRSTSSFRFGSGAWQAVGGGTLGSARAFLPMGSGLIVGGSFTEAAQPGGESVAASRIVRWNGSRWSNLGAGFNGAVNAIASWRGRVVAGGAFSASGRRDANGVAWWDSRRRIWQSLGRGLPTEVQSLTTHDGRLIAGLTSSARPVQQWTGTNWRPIGAAFGPRSRINAMLSHGGNLYVGGVFERAGGQAARAVARFRGGAWEPLAEGLSGSARVTSMVVYRGEVIVGGQFTESDGNVSSFVARWAPVDGPASVGSAALQLGGEGTLTIAGLAPRADARFLWIRNGRAIDDGRSASGSVIHGARTAALTIEGVTEADAGTYELCVSLPDGPSIHTVDVVTIEPAPAPGPGPAPNPNPTPDSGEDPAYAGLAWPPHNTSALLAADIQGRLLPAALGSETYLTGVPDLSNRVRVIEFWATWCPPCVPAAAKLGALQDAHPQKLGIIAITDERPDDRRLLNYMSFFSHGYAVASDPSRTLMNAIRVQAIPLALIISTDGRVRWQGNPNDANFEAIVAAVIAVDPLTRTTIPPRRGRRGG